MHQQWSSLRIVGGDYAAMECQHGRGIVRHSMVRPSCEVILIELERLVATLDLAEGGRGREGRREREGEGEMGERMEGRREGGKERRPMNDHTAECIHLTTHIPLYAIT